MAESVEETFVDYLYRQIVLDLPRKEQLQIVQDILFDEQLFFHKKRGV